MSREREKKRERREKERLGARGEVLLLAVEARTKHGLGRHGRRIRGSWSSAVHWIVSMAGSSGGGDLDLGAAAGWLVGGMSEGRQAGGGRL